MDSETENMARALALPQHRIKRAAPSDVRSRRVKVVKERGVRAASGFKGGGEVR